MEKKFNNDPNYYRRFKRKPLYIYVDSTRYLVLRYDHMYYYLSNNKKIRKIYADPEPGVSQITYHVDFVNKKLIQVQKTRRQVCTK